MVKLKKKEILDLLADESGLSTKDCDAVVTSLVELIKQSNLENDTAVPITGLGTFMPNHKKARVGRNPRTGESVDIAAKTVIKFKLSASTKK